ncbi:hypothetical protein ACKLNR_014083 [Fusarium oxysporum f. sp. zingiberi]
MTVTFPAALMLRTQVQLLIQLQEQFGQELQQIRSLVDQIVPPPEYKYAGYIHILFSLANIQRLLSPDTSLSTFIKNSRCTDPLKFIVINIQRQRAHLRLPYKTWDEIINNTEGCTNENYVHYVKNNMILSIGGVPSQADPLSVLLQKWKEQGSKGQDHEVIDYSSIKEPELAIIIGYEMGAAGCCAHPAFARPEEQLLRLGTGWIEGTCDVQEPWMNTRIWDSMS